MNFIKNRNLKNNREEDIPSLVDFGQVAWTLISFIYKSSWNALKIDDINISFYQKFSTKFSNKVLVLKSGKKTKKSPTKNPVKFSNLLPILVPLRPSKKELSKSKYYGKNHKKIQNQSGKKKECTYAQVLSGNIKEILKLKNKFSNLLTKKIKDIHSLKNIKFDIIIDFIYIDH